MSDLVRNHIVGFPTRRLKYLLSMFICFRKNVPDYSAGRAKNDLGFVMFDLQSDIL